jgi:RHS repeat-associated protein
VKLRANQLTNGTRTGTLTVAGTTWGPATSVTVNGSSAALYGDRTFAKDGFTVTNGQNSFTAIATDSYGRTDTNTISANLPATNSFAHDLNGNLTNWNGRSFEYDDENQLTRITEAGSWKTELAYDGKMRLRVRKEYGWISSTWVQTNEVRFVYDGMLCVQERDGQNFPVQTHTRGLDLSGSREGAGGIGGLLASTESGLLNPVSYFFHADGNGNVTALVNALGVVVGRYSYDPYGNTLSLSGTRALVNRFRFSSKEHHAQSGLYYYGYRFYVPELQRWVNRDPIGEQGGINLYFYVGNTPIQFVDPDGLDWVNWPIFQQWEKITRPLRPDQDHSNDDFFPFDPANDGIQPADGDFDWMLPLKCNFFGKGRKTGFPTPGLLNASSKFRIGWGWKGPQKTGKKVFRIAGEWIKKVKDNPHIDLWPPSEW